MQTTARVELVTRRQCHLCDDARTIVAEVCEREGVTWQETDIDAEPALVDKWGDYVPVVLVDGVQRAFWRVDARRLTRALGGPQ